MHAYLHKVYEMYMGVVCRLTRAEDEMQDSLRPFVPPKLRNTIIHNYHASICMGCAQRRKGYLQGDRIKVLLAWHVRRST